MQKWADERGTISYQVLISARRKKAFLYQRFLCVIWKLDPYPLLTKTKSREVAQKNWISSNVADNKKTAISLLHNSCLLM